MQLKDVHEFVNDMKAYLSRCQDKNQSIEILKLAVLFDLSESLKTISETLTDPDIENGIVDMFQRVSCSINDLSDSLTEDIEKIRFSNKL